MIVLLWDAACRKDCRKAWTEAPDTCLDRSTGHVSKFVDKKEHIHNTHLHLR